MSEFGLPARNATQDANAGIINPPAMKHANRQTAVKQQQLSSLDIGVQSFGQTLGSVLQSKLEGVANNINEQRATEAAIRQGQEHAINQIDANKQRHGWEKAVFGENVEYRAAQQRAAQNAVQSMYLEQATTIDDFAGETPDEYSKRLRTGLDKVLEPYGGDKETKSLITQAWATSSAKLAAKQYESHYAYNQMQQRDTFAKHVQQTFDTWTVDASLVSTPEEARGTLSTASKFFEGSTKPAGMSDIAWKSVVNDQINASLRQGNIGAYNAANMNGWTKNLSVSEQVALDQAISAYDTDFSQKVSLAYENAELAAAETKTYDEAASIYQNLRTGLTSLGNRSSGTDRAEVALTRGHVSAQKEINRINDNRKKMEEEATKIARKAAEKAAEAEVEMRRINTMKDALRVDDPIKRAGVLNELDPKRSELEDTLDLTIVEDIAKAAGFDEMSKVEATKFLLENPLAARGIAARVKSQEVDSPFVKRTVETFLNGYTGLVGETGQLNARGIKAMQSVKQFAQNEDNFKSMIGTDNFDKFEIITRGLEIGQTADQVNKDIEAYQANKGNRDVYGIQWELAEKESKRDRVQSLVTGFTNQTPNGASLAHYMEEYDRALVIYKGDRKSAEKYLRTSALNAAINYKGKVITNGKKLNQVTSFNFEQLMDGAQKTTGNSASLLTPYLAAMGVKLEDAAGKALTSLDQVAETSLYTVDGIDGFFLDARDAQSPVHITTDTMKRWESTLKQRTNFNKLRDKVDGKVLDAWLEEQQILSNAKPMMVGY